MIHHGIVDLVDNCLPCGLNSEHLGDLDDMVGRGLFSDDACEVSIKEVPRRQRCLTLGSHDLLQAVSFHKQFLVSLFASVVVFFLDIDDSSTDS